MNRRLRRAFSLTEVLIVITILGILVAVVVPSYQGQVLKTRRTDAKQALIRTAQQLERCFTRYRRFDSRSCTLVSTGPNVSLDSPDGHYRLSTLSANGSETLAPESFTLFATPQGAQARDTSCARFQLSHTLGKGAQDDAGSDSTARCW